MSHSGSLKKVVVAYAKYYLHVWLKGLRKTTKTLQYY
jgi:hypothetical protein